MAQSTPIPAATGSTPTSAAVDSLAFPTPAPISASVELEVGNLRIDASDRSDTVVHVRPSDQGRVGDLAAAKRIAVDCAGGTLTVKAPRRWTRYTPWGGREPESVDVEILLPAGSSLHVDAGVGAVRCAGRLGECWVRSGLGEVLMDQVGPLDLHTGGGDVNVDRVAGRLELSTGTGGVRVGAVDGPAVVKNSNGDTWLGEVGGDLEVRAANGRISVDCAGASVVARSANGDIRLGEVSRGAVQARTAMGKVEVGIRRGVAAWLDLHTSWGNVTKDLEGGGPPGPGEETVELRVRTSFGDITVRRS